MLLLKMICKNYEFLKEATIFSTETHTITAYSAFPAQDNLKIQVFNVCPADITII